jgi:uncharacterized protein
LRKLVLIDERVEGRARATREAFGGRWPCARGCDHCCRSLPHLPEVTEPEWTRIADGIDALPEQVRLGVLRRVHEEEGREGPRRNVVCPMLDEVEGACLVYEARPVACRTYGFYTERDASLACSIVMSAVADHEARDEAMMWGNGEAIAQDLAAFGERASIATWLAAGLTSGR